jgi:preprotein translocase subunit SecD
VITLVCGRSIQNSGLVAICRQSLCIGALTMFHFILTLPGIAGIILTIGLSVDRRAHLRTLREEMALGNAQVAVKRPEKAQPHFDANVTT